MKRTNFHAMFAVVAVFCASSVVFAQNASTPSAVSDTYLISAKAGGVNYVEGNVTVVRAAGRSGVLLKRDRVEIGDRVTTGPNGRAEILLNPGSYIRLGQNTSFEFGSTDLEDLHLTLDSGSAMFEVFAADEFRVSVFTPKGKLALVDTGIYRVDISPDGTALLSVTKGLAEVGDANATLVKGGRTGTVGTDMVAVAKFDKDKRDYLGEWSKIRSKELARIASNLQNRNLGRSLLNTYNSGHWGLYGSFGLWIFDASYGGHCFLPFGGGFRSPYGHHYWNRINWWDLPPRYNNPPVVAVPTRRKAWESQRNSEVGTLDRVKTRSGNDKGSVRETANRIEPPPFTRIIRGGNSGYANTPVSKGMSDFGAVRSIDSGRSYSAPVYSAPVYSAPVISGPKGKN